MKTITACDTQTYHDSYDVTFSNVLYMHKKYGLEICHTHRDSGAYILTDFRGEHTTPIIGEHYILCAHEDADPALLEDMVFLEEQYPCMDDELLQDVQDRILGQSLSAIFESTAEEAGFLWLYQHYRMKYWEGESEEFLDYEQHPFDMKIAAACRYFSRTSPIRYLQENVYYTDTGAHFYTVQHQQEFARLLRRRMFDFANGIRKRRLNAWKDNWGTLL